MRDVVLLRRSSPAWKQASWSVSLGTLSVSNIRSHFHFRNCVNKFLNFHQDLVLVVLQDLFGAVTQH